MNVKGEMFRAPMAASALLVLQACGAPESAQGAPEEPASIKQMQASQPAASSVGNADEGAPEGSPGAFHLEWGKDDALCASARATLKAGSALKTDTAPAADYAERQARRYLSADAAVEWRAQEPPIAGTQASEISVIEYFNDGIRRNVVRMHGKISGQSVITLGVIGTDGAKVAPLSFAHAGATFSDLPDKDNLSTKLAYSVSEVVKLAQGFFTMVMPLEDVDGSNRIYLARWRAKEGTTAPRAPSDYYAELACVFRANASTK